MKEISQKDAARIMKVGQSRWQAATINKRLAAFDYSPANKIPTASGVAYSYWDVQVRDTVKREAEKARAARESLAPAPTKQAPLPLAQKLEDDDIKEIKRLLEGHTSYACRTGDEVAKLRSTIERLESENRILIIAMNRLLKAANLPLVPEIGANGATHSAPEARQ